MLTLVYLTKYTAQIAVKGPQFTMPTETSIRAAERALAAGDLSVLPLLVRLLERAGDSERLPHVRVMAGQCFGCGGEPDAYSENERDHCCTPCFVRRMGSGECQHRDGCYNADDAPCQR